MLTCIADKEVEASHQPVQQFLRAGIAYIFEQDQELGFTIFFVADVYCFDQSVGKNTNQSPGASATLADSYFASA